MRISRGTRRRIAGAVRQLYDVDGSHERHPIGYPRSHPCRSGPSRVRIAAGAAVSLLAGGAGAQPVPRVWPVTGAGDATATAAAPVSGWYATAGTGDDAVQLRDINRVLVRRITRAEIAALLPWMELGNGPD